MNPLVIMVGVLLGLAVFAFIAALRPAPPRLDAALARLTGTDPAAARTSSVDGTVDGLRRWLTRQLAAPGRLSIPRRDLDLVGDSVEQFVVQKVLCLLGGLLVPTLIGSGLRFASLGLSWAVPAGAGLIAAGLMFFAPDLAVRVDAGKRRTEFRAALTSYLDLVALERAAGAHPNEALETSAALSDGWAFARIQAVLERSRRAQVPPWRGLAELGEEIGVPELADLATITEVAGAEGAQILETLLAMTESMRGARTADARAQANSRTTTMVVPVALLGFGFMLLLTFPVLYRMLTTG